MSSTTTDRIDGVNAELALKAPVKAATTANITLSAEQTIDDIAVVDGDRVLVKDQTDGSENGIYCVSTGSWTREPDWDGGGDVVQGTSVRVNQGTANAATFFAVDTTGTITVGTTSVAISSTSGLAQALTAASVIATMVAQTNTFTAAQIFQLSDNGATVGPDLKLDRISNSAADNDILGRLLFTGRNDNATPQEWNAASVFATATDVSDGSEDAGLSIATMAGGALANRLQVLLGLVMQGATGGDKGAGTINATAVYQNGVQITDSVPRSYLAGLTMSNDSDADHDIAVSAGVARDTANALNGTNSATVTKQIDVEWASGDDAGGLANGVSLSADTWYHFFMLFASDGTTDFGFDTSLTAANLIGDADVVTAGFDQGYRRLGSVLTDSSSNIIAFVQIGDEFIWVNPTLDIDGTITTTAANQALSTPSGVKTKAHVNALHSNGAIYLSSIDQTDEAVSDSAAPLQSLDTAGGTVGQGPISVMTDTSSQIRARGSTGTNTLRIATLGYTDTRGRNA